MPRPRSVVSLLALVALPVLAASCSVGKKELRTDEIETQIAQQFASSQGVKVKTVSCPNDQEVKAGATFTCDVTLQSGARRVVTIKQLDDKGHVQWSVGGA